MTTTWTTAPYKVSLRGLAKPYEQNPDAERRASIQQVSLTNGGRAADVSTVNKKALHQVLAYLDEAGYLAHAQEVELRLLDNFVLLVNFAYQLPMDIDHHELLSMLPRDTGIICGVRIIVLSASSLKQLKEAAAQLWGRLAAQGVVRGSMPVFRPAH